MSKYDVVQPTDALLIVSKKVGINKGESEWLYISYDSIHGIIRQESSNWIKLERSNRENDVVLHFEDDLKAEDCCAVLHSKVVQYHTRKYEK